MRRLIVSLVVAFAGLGAAQAQPPLPDMTAVRTVGPDKKPTLAGWKATAPPKVGDLRYSLHIEPENKLFAGARAFAGSTHEADAVAAAKKIAAAEGFETIRLLSETKVDAAVAERLEKGGKVSAVMLEGQMAGKPARFIGHVWYGARGEPDGKAASGVHGFAAPEPAFVALGGYAIPAILFVQATATPNTPMSVDGSLPPKQATDDLAKLFTAWARTLGPGDNLSTLNGIMQGNLGVQVGTGCINTPGCVGGGTAPVYTSPRY
jgi:hypothetical protein